ncbi:unnamed protein product [Chilo suppressalis]|uniref:Cytochrome P450 n=2 Tax=Chilo suppressalis TaxID=168631 RepID=A0ABN8L850_CHISP|nr:unnamed protein product [Chilo suppressalis]
MLLSSFVVFLAFWERLLDIQMDCIKKGSVTLLHAGINPNYTYYVACDPDDVSTVLNSCLERSFLLTDHVKAVFGNGLATSSVSVWRSRRKRLEAVFNKLQFSTDVMVNEQTILLIEELAPKADKASFDPSRYLKYAIMRTLFTMIFTESQHDEEFCKHVDLCIKATENVSKALYVKHKNIFTHNNFIFNNCTKSKSMQEEAIGILNDVINENMKKEIAIGNEVEKSQVTDSEKLGLLNYLLKLRAESIYNDDDVIKEILSIIFSGYFTMSYTLLNVLNMLGSHLTVQEKLYKEISSLPNTSEKIIKMDNLSQLPFSDAVIMETLRLYPPISFISRLVDKEVVLGKYKLETNSNCLLCVYAMNRHPKWGEDADEFKPERWLEDVASKPFASFGLGERNCIGKLWSLSIMKRLLIGIMREYVVYRNADAMTMKQKLFLHSESGHYISLQKRSTVEKKTVNGENINK